MRSIEKFARSIQYTSLPASDLFFFTDELIDVKKNADEWQINKAWQKSKIY